MDFSNLQNRERFVIELFLGMILIIFLALLTFLVVGNVDAKQNNIQPTGINVVNSYNNYVRPINERQRENHFDSMQRIHKNRMVYYDNDEYDWEYDDERGHRRFYRYGDRFDEENYYGYDYYDERKIKDYKSIKTYERPLEFSDDGRQNRYSNLFNKDVDNFEVYVYNDEEAGGYFEVTFTFEDAYGRERSFSETKYIYPGKEVKFFYKDVSPRYSEYKNWNYEVKSHSKVPYKTVYYN